MRVNRIGRNPNYIRLKLAQGSIGITESLGLQCASRSVIFGVEEDNFRLGTEASKFDVNLATILQPQNEGRGMSFARLLAHYLHRCDFYNGKNIFIRLPDP